MTGKPGWAGQSEGSGTALHALQGSGHSLGLCPDPSGPGAMCYGHWWVLSPVAGIFQKPLSCPVRVISHRRTQQAEAESAFHSRCCLEPPGGRSESCRASPGLLWAAKPFPPSSFPAAMRFHKQKGKREVSYLATIVLKNDSRSLSGAAPCVDGVDASSAVASSECGFPGGCCLCHTVFPSQYVSDPALKAFHRLLLRRRHFSHRPVLSCLVCCGLRVKTQTTAQPEQST